MTGVSIRIEIKDAKVRAALRNVEHLAADMAPVMQGIAFLLEGSTEKRFATETAPDGTRWKPSLRAQLKGGLTLTKDSYLVKSITSAAGRDFAQVGSNRIYAGIHQFGGEIKPKGGGALMFRLASGQFVTVKQVTMPARPFLGISADDERDIRDLVVEHFERRLQ